MVKPLTEKQTNDQDPIYPRIKRAIILGSSRFDDVWRPSKKTKFKYVQMYSDLPGIYKDHHYFEKLVTRFGFEQDEFLPLLEPKMKQCIDMANQLNKLFKQNPEETPLAFFCYASHGMIQSGRQVILVNECN